METAVIKIFEFLRGQSLQVAIVFIGVLVLTWLLRNKSAHVRYLLWLLVAIKCLTPPLVIFSVPVLPAETIPVVIPAQNAEINYQPTQTTVINISPEEVQSQSPIENRKSFIENSPITRLHLTSTGVLLSAWAAGAAFYLLWALGKAVRLGMQLKQIRRPLPPKLVIEQIEMLARLWDYPGGFKVWLVDGINQPFVWGLWRGAIYLPSRFQSIQGDKQKAIVLHEMAHVVRFDAFVNLIQILIQGIFWFHPLVWLANRAIRQEREKCCDEIAVARLGTAPKEYGSAIVDTLLQEAQSAIAIPTLAVAGPVKNIEDRIKTIMQPGRRFFRRPSTIALLIVGVLAAFIIPTTIALTQKVTPPDYMLSGTVTDAQTEKPVAGVIVFDNGYGPQPYQKGITDDNGKFEYKSWNEEHNVAAKADGYQTQTMTFMTFPLDNSKKLNFKLQPASTHEESEICVMLQSISFPNDEAQLKLFFDKAGVELPQFAMSVTQDSAGSQNSGKLTYGQSVFLSPQDVKKIIKSTQSFADAKILTSPKAIVRSGEMATMEISIVQAVPEGKKLFSMQITPSLVAGGILSEFALISSDTLSVESNQIEQTTQIQSKVLIPRDKILLILGPDYYQEFLDKQSTAQKPQRRMIFLLEARQQSTQDTATPASSSNLGTAPLNSGGMGAFIPAVSSPFTAMLSDGVTVELSSVCEAGSAGKACWAPDGALLPKASYAATGIVSWPQKDGYKLYEFTLRLNRPENTSYYWMIPGGSYASDTGMPKDENGNYISALRTYTADQSADQPTALVQIGITDQAWKTIAIHKPQDGEETLKDGDYEIAFGRAYVNGKETLLPLVHNYNVKEKIYAIRVVAITTDNQVQKSGYSGRGGEVLKNLTYSFYDLPMESIKEFRFQIRPYQWITFRDVSLRPGQQTDVKIELPVTSIQERLDAMNHVRQAALACLMYADDNGKKLPNTLEQINQYNDVLPLDKMELLQAGQMLTEIKTPASTPLLLMRLDSEKGSAVGFADGHAEYFTPERMKTSAYPDTTAASTLEFRVVPETGKDISESDLQKYKETLQTQGPDGACNGYKWIAAGTAEKASWYETLPNHRYKNTSYVLLCDQPDKRMLADETWGLQKVSVEADSLNNPTILTEFDDAGASRFGELTKQNIGRQIAIIIDGNFFSAPRVQTAISKQAAITGNFTNQEVGNLVQALIQGMPPLGARQN